MDNTGNLVCVIQTTPTPATTSLVPEERNIPLRPDIDEKKKSVFWLHYPKDVLKEKQETDNQDQDNGWTILQPAECVLRSVAGKDFFFAGFQLWSTAQQVQVSTVFDNFDDYIMTVKGMKQSIQSINNCKPTDSIYKSMCVVPGGPRRVHIVKLKLICGSTEAKQVLLQTIRWTLRIATKTESLLAEPQPQQQQQQQSVPLQTAESTKTNALPIKPQQRQQQQQQQQNQQFNPSSSDIGAMMAGMSFTIRQSEDRLTKLVLEETRQLQRQLGLTMQQLQMLQQQGVQQQRTYELVIEQLKYDNHHLHQTQQRILGELRALQHERQLHQQSCTGTGIQNGSPCACCIDGINSTFQYKAELENEGIDSETPSSTRCVESEMQTQTTNDDDYIQEDYSVSAPMTENESHETTM